MPVSQAAAVLAVVGISLLLLLNLEAERGGALADGRGGEESEQPDDAPDGETPLARFAAGQPAVCFREQQGKLALQSCSSAPTPT